MPDTEDSALARRLRAAVQDRWIVLFLVLALLQLLPIWVTPMFPSQDGPSHLENAQILLDLGDAESRSAELYEVRLAPIPNWVAHLVLAGLMAFLPALLAEKVLLSLIVAGFVGAAAYLVRGVRGSTPVAVLLAMPFAHHLAVYGGMYSFSLGLVLVLVALGLWWRWRAQPLSAGRVVALNALLLGMYLVHLMAPVLALLGIGVLAGWVHRARLRRAVLAVAAVLPAALPPLIYLASGSGGETHRWPAALLVSWFVRLGSIVSHDDPLRSSLGPAVFLAFVALVIVTMVVRVRARSTGLEDRDGFAVLALVYLLLYAVVPDWTASGNAVSFRLCLMPFLAILPWLTIPANRRAVLVAAAVTLTLGGVHLSLTTANNVLLARGLQEYTSGIAAVRPGETLLPLSFNHRGESPFVSIYLHAGSHYALEAGAINLVNYEASTGHFPLRYREGHDPALWLGDVENAPDQVDPGGGPLPVDIVLLWCPPPQALGAPWLVRDYELIHAEGRLWLFRRAAD